MKAAPLSFRVSDELRGGRLPPPDQATRDRLIADLYAAGARQSELEAAFLVSRGTIWAALKRMKAQISMSEVALRREARRRSA